MDANKDLGSTANAPSAVSFYEAFLFWLKLGFISFGGPAGQIAIMHQELVENKRWISEKRFLHALNYCMVLPGPEALQLAIYIGWLMHRTLGGIVAGLLFILPSLLLLIVLSWIYIAFQHLPVIAGIFYGIKPAVTAIVFQATFRIGSRSLKSAFLKAIAFAAFAAIFFANVPFPLIVLVAAIAGYIGGKVNPEFFNSKDGHSASNKSYGRALIDDNTPSPAHAKYSIKHTSKLVLVGLSLWAIPIGILVLNWGWGGVFTQMGVFFTKAAMLTFGGAYAVLPYVYQAAVENYGWLTASQMIDGLALGETTPGPLIIVVSFVGFVGGYVNHVLSGSSQFVSGALGACIVSWFTFLPSFLFILLGAPLVESTKENLKLSYPMTAITAAVVGVILNLAIFFGYHTIWVGGWRGQIDFTALLIAIAAFVALFKFKANVIAVICAAAILGLVFTVAA